MTQCISVIILNFAVCFPAANVYARSLVLMAIMNNDYTFLLLVTFYSKLISDIRRSDKT